MDNVRLGQLLLTWMNILGEVKKAYLIFDPRIVKFAADASNLVSNSACSPPSKETQRNSSSLGC